MSEHNKRESSSTPVAPPVKRKRGRPRKDENFVQKERAPLSQAPSSDGVSNQHAEVDPTDSDNGMVGQVVSGIIEGSFDAGYFLSVRAGNTDTLLRGVVFQPGLFTPITAANDVAPNAKMYKRRELPIPIAPFPLAKQSGHTTDSLPNYLHASLEAKDTPQQNRVFGLENQFAHQLRSATPFALATTQSASAMVPPLTGISCNASLGEKNFPQQNSVSGLEKQSYTQVKSGTQFPITSGYASSAEKSFEPLLDNQPIPHLQKGTILPLTDQSASIVVSPAGNLPKNDSGATMEGNNSAQQNLLFECRGMKDEIMEELGASTLVERHQNDVDETKDVVKASEPAGDVFPSKENINQMPQVQHQVVDSELRSSESTQDEIKSRYLELHSLVGANSRSLPPDKHISQENDTQVVSQSAPIDNEPLQIMGEADPSEPEVNNTGGGCFFPKINQPLTFMEEKSV
ncbi:hypothetical protein U1Q18_008913 [Sarracenia purpurea var. burkii]